jgi:molybdopterin-guanine dinucleotide biosynthesis protein A
MEDITAVILAGGKSRRMKTDKALIKFNDRTLLENQIDLLNPIFNKIIISANSQNYSFANLQIINDEQSDLGPIGGILSVLKKVKTDYVFIISVDMPLITTGLIKHLISKKANYDIVLPVFNDKYEPTCAVYSRNCINTIEEQIFAKDYKLKNFIEKSNTNFVEINENSEFYNKDLFVNLNSPKDLIDIKKKY